MAYKTPVTIETRKINSGVINIEYPKVSGLGNPRVTDQINRALTELVQWMHTRYLFSIVRNYTLLCRLSDVPYI